MSPNIELFICDLLSVDLLSKHFYDNSIGGKIMDKICKKFGANVRKYRTEKGYSQEKFAEITGLHRTYISALERGKRSISLENIEKISKGLEIETFMLFIFS